MENVALFLTFKELVNSFTVFIQNLIQGHDVGERVEKACDPGANFKGAPKSSSE